MSKQKYYGITKSFIIYKTLIYIDICSTPVCGLNLDHVSCRLPELREKNKHLTVTDILPSSPKMALRGLRVVEFAGLAPGPMCGMILADFGAKVVRVDRIGGAALEQDSLSRGKLSLAVDLKREEGCTVVKEVLHFGFMAWWSN